jgi:hypothetical protein
MSPIAQTPVSPDEAQLAGLFASLEGFSADAEKPKKGGGRVAPPLPPSLVTALEAMLQTNAGVYNYVGDKTSRDRIGRQVKQWAEEQNLRLAKAGDAVRVKPGFTQDSRNTPGTGVVYITVRTA